MPTADTTRTIRKAPARRKAVAEVDTSTTTKRKRPTRKGPPQPAKAVTAKPRKQQKPRESRGMKFNVGSDMALAFEELQRGGQTRTEVNARIMERFGETKTRAGNPKPVTTIVNQVLRRALENGWTVEASWRLVQPAGGAPEGVKVVDTSDLPHMPQFIAPASPTDEQETVPVRPTPARKPKPTRRATPPRRKTA